MIDKIQVSFISFFGLFSETTITLETYCINIDGAVKGSAVPLSSIQSADNK